MFEASWSNTELKFSWRTQRCDGQKPICGPCARFRGQEIDDCEFYEGQPPMTQRLRERVADLEDRLSQLQGLEDPGQLRLRPPYSPGQTRNTSGECPNYQCPNHYPKRNT